MGRLRSIAPASLRGWGLLAAASAVLIGLALLAVPIVSPSAERQRQPALRPNIVLIQTDDQTLASFNRKTMPNAHRLLVDRGTTFTDYVVTSPLCCPSRASLLTGQYPHNHGVVSNTAGYASLSDKRNTLPAWLQRVGYQTAHVGKFLNNYDGYALAGEAAAPGWNEWVTMLPPYSYFDHELGVNGRSVRYGSGDSDYLTTVLNRWAARIVRRAAPQPEPFFLAVDQFAPHGQGVEKEGGCGRTALPLPGDFRRFARERLPLPPSFDESDVSDKPPFRQLVSELSGGRIDGMRENYRCRLASLRAVDRGVKRVFAALRRSGELDHTAVVFTSDNGFLQGEHRIPAQKAQAYEEAIRVPLVIRAPARSHEQTEVPGRVGAPVANIDIAPTLLDLAGAGSCRDPSDCRVMDGLSLVGLLEGRRAEWARERALLTSFESGHRRNAPTEGCRFAAIRTRSHSYVEYEALPDPDTRECRPDFARELYDLRRDPYQLRNIAEKVPELARRVELSIRLEGLRRCAGIAGRDEREPDRPYCG